MGSSKIIMLSGVYLILGFYTISFYNAERTSSTTVEAVANTVQAEQLARTGISLALVQLGDNSAVNSFTEKTASLSSGTISYSATGLTATTTQITSSAEFNGRTITMSAVFTYNNGRWRITRIYSTPTAELVS